MDRRQKRTVEAIVRAFCILIKQKCFEKITVQEIIDEANIGRSTFYSHFETKEALLSKICEEMFSHIFMTALKVDASGERIHRSKNETLEHILFHIKNDNQEILGILINQSNLIFLNSFKVYFYKVIEDILLSPNTHKSTNIPREVIKNHLHCSFIGIVQIWIEGGFIESEETIAKYYIDMTSSVLA